MNNDKRFETAIAGLNCWACYETDDDVVRIVHIFFGSCLYASRAGPHSARQPGKRDEFGLCLYRKISSRLLDNFVVLTIC